MSDSNDAADFVREADDGDGAVMPVNKSRALTDRELEDFIFDENVASRKQAVLSPAQYAVIQDGYLPTAPTVKLLPPGGYEIMNSKMGPFASPTIAPQGLLLNLPEMRSDDVLRIVDTFWASEADYKDGNEFVVGGAAYRAGIMLFGPPGSGKSCTIKLLSKKLIAQGGTVFHSSGPPEPLSNFLTSFFRIEPTRKCIVILEDIDSLLSMYGESGYLDILDSAKSISNVMFIATTNYPDRLDRRIYNRPGRFSHVIKIGLPSANTRRAYLKAILKNHRDVEEIVLGSGNFTIDHLTALVNAVYREKKDLKEEMVRLRVLFQVPKSEDNEISMRVGI